MRIKYLGTSAAWPLPRLGCACHICSSKDPKDTRTRTQLLVNECLLLDVGIDTYQHLKKYADATKIRYASITHEHPDHTFGLWDLGHVYGARKVEIFIHESTYKKTRQLFFPGEYKLSFIKEGESQILKNITLTLLRVNHTRSSFGILLQEENKKVFYAPDFRSLPDETKKQLMGADLLVLEGSELEINTKNHQSIKDNIKLASELQVKEVYFVHLGHRTLPHKKLEDYVSKFGNFHVSYDGLEIKI